MKPLYVASRVVTHNHFSRLSTSAKTPTVISFILSNSDVKYVGDLENHLPKSSGSVQLQPMDAMELQTTCENV